MGLSVTLYSCQEQVTIVSVRDDFCPGLGWTARRPAHRVGQLVIRAAAILVATALVALVPLAHSTPPDPTWIPGLYDDADYDNVVLAITGGVGLAVAHVSIILLPDGARKLSVLASSSKPAKPLRISLVDRSPPLA